MCVVYAAAGLIDGCGLWVWSSLCAWTGTHRMPVGTKRKCVMAIDTSGTKPVSVYVISPPLMVRPEAESSPPAVAAESSSLSFHVQSPTRLSTASPTSPATASSQIPHSSPPIPLPSSSPPAAIPTRICSGMGSIPPRMGIGSRLMPLRLFWLATSCCLQPSDGYPMPRYRYPGLASRP